MTQALGMAPGLSSLVMYIGTGGLAGKPSTMPAFSTPWRRPAH